MTIKLYDFVSNSEMKRVTIMRERMSPEDIKIQKIIVEWLMDYQDMLSDGYSYYLLCDDEDLKESIDRIACNLVERLNNVIPQNQ